MIFTYSVLKGYKAIMGNAVLHLPFLVVSLWYITVPKGLGPAIDKDLNNLFKLQMLVHILNSVIWAMELNIKEYKRMEMLVEVTSILALVFQFFVFMLQFNVLAFLADASDLGPINARSKDFIEFHFWVQLEVCFVYAMVFANMLALAIRFCVKTPLEIEPKNFEETQIVGLDEEEQNQMLQYMQEGTDYLKGTFILITTFTIFAAPLFINLMLLIMDGDKIRDMTIGWYFLTADQKDVFETNLIFTILSTAGYTLLLFNPFQKADVFPGVVRVGCKVIGLITTFAAVIVIPIVQMIYNSVKWEEAKIKESPIALWLMIQMGVFVTIYTLFLLQLISGVIAAICTGKKEKDKNEESPLKTEESQQKTREEEMEILITTRVNSKEGLKKYLNYDEELRKKGEGPIRIGTNLDLDKDIFSMLFVLCISPKYYYYYMEVKGKDYDFPKEPKEDDPLDDIPEDDDKIRAKTIAQTYGRLPEKTLTTEAQEHFQKGVRGIKKVMRKSLGDIVSQALITWLFQIIICGLIFNETRQYKWNTFILRGVDVTFARFVAGIMMHVAMTAELKQGMAKMKFVVNHIWRFEFPMIAFAAGFAQCSMIVFVTIINYIVITARAQSVFDVVMDFLALMVISDFDNFFYAEHSTETEVSKMIVEEEEYSDMFQIMITTARNAQPFTKEKTAKDFLPTETKSAEADPAKADPAKTDPAEDKKNEKKPQFECTQDEAEECARRHNENLTKYNKFTPLKATAWIDSIEKCMGNPLNGDGKPGPLKSAPMYIGVKAKCCTLQHFLQSVYRFMRFLYVSFWYYFSPFFFTSFQFTLPLYVLYRDGKLPDVVIEEG